MGAPDGPGGGGPAVAADGAPAGRVDGAPGGAGPTRGTHDPARLAALRATGLLDSPPEPAFDRLTRLAAALLGAPVAAVSLVDEGRQFFKSAVGLPEPWASRRETPLSHSFCRHVVDRGQPLIIDDASAHPLGREHRAVDELGVGAYLGVPLETNGHTFGALCVIDRPRAWRDDEVALVRDLAASVVAEIELRSALAEAKAKAAELERKSALLEAVLSSMSDAVAVTDGRGDFTLTNAAADRLFERAPGPGGGLAAEYGLYRADGVTPLPESEAPVVRALAGERVPRHELFVRTQSAPGGRWHSVNAAPVVVGGRVRGAVLVGHDVTDQREAAAALHEREARLRLLADSAFEGIAISSEGRLVDANEAFARLFGYERGGLAGMAATAFVTSGEHGRVARSQLEGYEGVYETVGLRHDGSTFPVEVRGRMVPWGGRTVRITAVRDLTERKLAEAALARQTAFVELLRATATEANAATSSGAALGACVGRVCEHMGWPVGHVYAVAAGAAGPELVPTGLGHFGDPARYKAFREVTMRTRLRPGVGLPGRVLATGRAHWFVDVGASDNFLRRDAARASGLRGGFAFPVLVGDEVAAVLEFYSGRAEEPDAPLLEVMANLGLQLGRVVERERARVVLERHAAETQALSVTDELTGLHNRRGFVAKAAPLLAGAGRSGRPALLFFADLNGLKQINDVHGHEAGDEAIRETARLLRATFRDADVLARLGGDEFVAFRPDARPEAVDALHGRLRALLEARNAAPGAPPYRLSVSLGAAAYDPRRPRPLDDLLAEADALMYEQKRRRKLAGVSLPAPPARVTSPSPAAADEGDVRD